MAIRMSGLASGMDTESIVQALMAAKTAKKTKVENKKTKLEWTQSIWSGLNTKLYKFYTDYVGKIRFQSSFQTKKATSSDTSKLTATASSSASKGSYSIKVQQLATAQSVIGAKLSGYTTTDKNGNTVTKDVTGSTKLSALGFATDGSSQINVTAGTKKVTLNVDAGTTVNDFVSNLQNAGLNASFDEKQGRFFISSKDSGQDNSFTITTGTLSASQLAAKDDLLSAANYTGLSSSQQTTVKNLLVTLQNGTAEDKTTKAVTSLINMTDGNAKTQATNYYKSQLTEKYTNEYIELVASKDADGNDILDADGNVVMEERLTEAGLQALKDANLDNDTYVDVDRLAVVKSKLIAKKVNADIKTDEYQAKISDAIENGLRDESGNLLTDEDGNVLLEDKATRDLAITNAVEAYAAEISGGVQADAADSSALKLLGLGNIDGSAVAETDGNGMVVVAAADSIIQMNGATLTGSSTTMEVNGLTLDLLGVTDEEISLTVGDDNTAVYDMVKDFINQYNSILADLNEYYYADSARGYDPLTDEQKEAMSDDEVEKWETKIKDSLLRRDSTLGSVLDSMRTAMTAFTVKASNGKTYSLANLGITTGTDYKEYGLLHIKGDEDDTEYADSSLYTNVLQNMINEDPDTVAEVLSGIANNLYETLGKKMSSTRLSSALTFYNDKEMNSQLSTYKKEISDWEDKLAELEERYYSQFSAMETAMSKLNSQQNMFTNYLG